MLIKYLKKNSFTKKWFKNITTTLLLLSFFFSNIPYGVINQLSQKLRDSNVVDVMWKTQNSKSVVDSFRSNSVEAAEVTIDSAAITDASAEFGPSPTVVFTTEQTGYVFYVDVGNDLIYKKTTNGGTNWGADVVIDDVLTGWTNVSVWYDQWTPNDTTGTKIHIAAADDVTGDAYYTFLDTSGDTLKGSVISVIPQTTFTELVNSAPSITKGAGGALFLTANFAGTAGGYIYKSIDGAGDTWSDITPASWSSGSTDQIQLLPLLTDNDIIAVKADTVDNDIDYRIYDEVADTWDLAWTEINTLTDNATYDQWFSASLRKSTGDTYLAFANNTNNAANDIEFWSFDDGTRSWTQGANIRSDSNQLLSPIPLVDDESGDVYVAYLEGANANNFFGGGNIAGVVHTFYQKSTDGGITWSSRTGALNVTADDFKYLRGNLLSSNRLFVAYYNDDTNDIFGTTIWSSGFEVEANIDTAIPDATDEFGPAPSGVFVDEDVGYQFFVRTNSSLDATDEFGPSPSVVYTSANIGYAFFVDVTLQSLVYRKTINGGATWGGSNIIDTEINHGWTQVSVWYDQWTPGDTGSLIHIAAASDTTGDVFYSYVDTVDDSLRSSLVTAINQTTFTEAQNGAPSITKGGGGNLFISVNLASTAGGYVVKSIDSGDSWASINPSASASTDQIQLLPLLTDDDIIAIMADVSADVITYQTYDEVADTWSGSWTTIANLNDGGGGTYDQWFSATLATSTGDVYLTFNNETAVATNDIAFWSFDDGTRSWTQGGNVYDDSATVLSPVPFYQASTDTLYVAYARGTLAATMHIYFKNSTDGGASWSAESAQLSTTGDDFKSLKGNMTSDDNLYVVWYNDDTNQLVGDSLISPITGDGHITSAQSLVYRKTTNGGREWGTPWTVAVTGGTTAVAIWYDQWTPGDTTGTKIHIAFSDDVTDDYYYSYLDTANDKPNPPVAVILGTIISEAAVGVPGITKGANGNLFLSGNFVTTAGGLVAKSTDDGESWADITPASWSSGSTDQIQLLPLLTDNDIIAVKADTVDNDIDYRIYDEVADTWDLAWTEINTLTDNATYDQWFSASLRKSTGDTYLAFANNTNNAANDIEFWSFDDGTRSWTQGDNVYDDSATVMMPVPLVNENNGDLYVAYLRGTLNSATSVYYKKSIDGGANWSNESNAINPGIFDTHFSLRGNLLSSDRLYLFLYNNDLNDIYGQTLEDKWRLDLSAFRFFENTDSTDVGSVLASQNTPATLVSDGDQFRLRVLVNSVNQFLSRGEYLKLQFAEKSGTCDIAFSGETYVDVTGATVIAYNDNATPTNGATLTANANDPTYSGATVVNQTYVESNNFTNSVGAVLSSQVGKWDFSLIDNGAPSDTSYCFRVVHSDGSLLSATGGSYSVIPEITTSGSSPVYSVSITSSGVVEYGFIELGNASSTVGNGYTQIAENDGNTTETLNIKSSNATGGAAWTLASSIGVDTFKHEFSTTTGSVWEVMPDSDTYVTAVPSILLSGTANFDFKLTAPSASTDYQQKSITITIQAVAP